MTQVILVHGINNETKSKEIIEKQWGDAIQKALQEFGSEKTKKVKFKAAFYGDILHSETSTWSQNSDAAVAMSATSPVSDYVSGPEAELYLAFVESLGITEDQIIAELSADDDAAQFQTMAKGIHKTWIKAIASVLEKVLPGQGRMLARLFLEQASAYLFKPGLKGKIDNLVYEQVFQKVEGDEKKIIISHSLGTVVTYSILRRHRALQKASLFVTAGSPLGIDIVKERLGGPKYCLGNVANWMNLSDPEDFVALKKKLNKNTFWCDNINNIYKINNGNENAHDPVRYFSQPKFIKELDRYL